MWCPCEFPFYTRGARHYVKADACFVCEMVRIPGFLDKSGTGVVKDQVSLVRQRGCPRDGWVWSCYFVAICERCSWLKRCGQCVLILFLWFLFGRGLARGVIISPCFHWYGYCCLIDVVYFGLKLVFVIL